MEKRITERSQIGKPYSGHSGTGHYLRGGGGGVTTWENHWSKTFYGPPKDRVTYLMPPLTIFTNLINLQFDYTHSLNNVNNII